MKSKTLTEKDKFQHILNMIRMDKMKIRIRVTKTRKDKLPNGTCDLQINTIYIYTHCKEETWSEMASILTHEYGHFLNYIECGWNKFHNEKLAWKRGLKWIKSIDPCLIPDKYNVMKEYCLESYKIHDTLKNKLQIA